VLDIEKKKKGVVGSEESDGRSPFSYKYSIFFFSPAV
jgi:hypothetical protein